MSVTEPAPLLSIDLPDLRFLSDEALETLLPFADGAWSRQTKAMLARSGLTKLNLNRNWAETARHWACPCCLRAKTDIARPSENGVLLCQLEWHHDHLRDLGKRELRGLLTPGDQSPEARALSRAIDRCKELTMRFHTALVCNDCNAAEGQAKTLVAGISKDFSFSPPEIARFIKVVPNRMHEVDPGAAREIWESVRLEVEDRIGFLDVLKARLSAGGLRVEGVPPRFEPSVNLAGLLARLVEQQGQSGSPLYGVAQAVEERSIRQDGFGVAKPKRAPAQRPSLEALAAYTATQPPEQPWRRAPHDWRCEVCDRDRRGVLRKSGSGRWTGKIHRHPVYLMEDDPQARYWRTGWFDDLGVIRSHRTAYICQDCRQIVTDLRSMDAGYSEDTFTIGDLKRIVRAIEPNRRHEVDMDLAKRLADENYEYLSLVADYRAHRSLSQSLTIELSTATDHFRMPLAEARAALFGLIASSSFSEDQLSDRLDWFLEEGRRLRREEDDRDSYLNPIERVS